ncbi:glycosyltransferase [Prosthecobacter sp.]|uniref:glycosyltransferase n=1 Tax=Prosthecobacter sp. TaxID=1965333 RepID=UPI001DEBE191|nr:glycosyltransferase [Prosthecobacter sp.]MCB1277637.1 glycosyltransferase family 1 protein [Prosthecobacter sp.]
MSHVLLLPFGTEGSIYPFIWLGRLLRHHGHRVTLVTAGRYAETVAGAGLEFAQVEGEDGLERMLAHPQLWQGNAGSQLSYRHSSRSTEGYVQAVEKLVANGNAVDLMLAPMICFGARLLREKLRIPLVTVHLYPLMFVSAHEPPLALPGFRLLRKLPLWVRKVVLAFPNPLDFFALPAVRACCQQHGVRKPWSLWKQWWHSPDGVLALFPEWYVGPQPDWPQKLLQWDFPLEDMSESEVLSPKLNAFLDAGEAPVLFTPGTGHFHAHAFFETAAELVRRLGCRAVFLTRKAEQVPDHLPPSILVESYAPFSRLLPRARAFVHHGGIGTVAQCLAAGISQLVVAMSLDQPDNADHVEQLGAGLGMNMRHFSVERALPLLKRCLTDASMQENARQYAARMAIRRDTGQLVAWLEKVISTGAGKDGSV